MIPTLVNCINTSKIKNIDSKIRYSKYILHILQKLESLEYVTIKEHSTRYIKFKAQSNFNKVIYFKPYRLSYSLNELTKIEAKLNRLYNGILLKNCSCGITTETIMGGQIILYVY